MATIIDSLEIQIESNSGNARRGLDELSAALERLRGNASVTKVTKNLAKLNTALDSLKGNSGTLNTLTTFANSLERLSNVGKMTGLSSAISALKKLPDVAAGLETANIERFSGNIERLTVALEPLATQIDKIATGFARLPPKINATAAATGKLDTATDDAVESEQRHNSALNIKRLNLAALVTTLRGYIAALKQVGDYLHSATSQAIEWDGIQYRFGRAFGEDAKEMLSYIDKVTDALMINKQEFMQYAGLYGSLLKGFGLEQEKVTTIARGLTGMTYDIWAANNDRYKRLEDAADAVRSAITGEIEPIRNAGIALSEASLKEYLADVGLAGVKMSELNEASKAQIRYAAMVKSAMQQGIVGTYARETMTAEGAVRTLSQQIKSLAQAIGSLFIPVLSAVIPWITAFVSVLYEAAAAIANLFGISFFKVDWSGASGGLGSIADSAESAGASMGGASAAAKELKNAVMDFDELNIIPSNDVGGGGGGGGGGAGGKGSLLDLDLPEYDFLGNQVTNQVEKIKKKIKPFIDWVKQHMQEILVIAAEIGTAIALWKISSAFLSALGATADQMNLVKSALALAATVAVTATLSYDFTNEYLETGKFSNLIADGLTTALGSAIAGGIAKNMGLGATGALYTAGTTLAISVATSILAIFKQAKMGNGFSLTKLPGYIWTALKGGAAGAVIAKAAGVSLLLGASAGVGLTLAGIALALTIGAASINPIEEVAWGDISLTKEEIEEFVETKLFTLDVNATINSVEVKIEDANTAKAGLRESLSEFSSSLNLLNLGIDDSKTLSSMLTSLTGGASDGTYSPDSLIGQLVSTLGKYDEVIRLGVGLVPPTGEGGTIDPEQLVADVGLTSTLIQSTVTSIGGDLAKALTDGIENGLDEQKGEMIKELAGWLNEINRAVAEGKVSGEFSGKTQILVDDMTRDTVMETLSQFSAMKEDLKKSYSDLAITELASMQSLAAGAEATYHVLEKKEGTTPEELEAAYQAWQSMETNVAAFQAEMQDYIADAVKNATEPANAILVEKVLEMFGNVLTTDKFLETDALGRTVIDYITSEFDGTSQSDIEDAATAIQSMINQVLESSLSEADLEAFNQVADVFDLSQFDMLAPETQKAIFDALQNAVGSESAQAVFNELGYSIPTGIAAGITQNTATAQGAASGLTAAISNTFTQYPWFNDGLSCGSEFVRGVMSAAGGLLGFRGTSSVGLTGARSALFGARSAIKGYAAGGFPETGEMFVAREAGAEMVGSLGGRTAVANNDQIVSGIASGVASANSEQNALLREQNALLTQLLRKEFKAQITPSAALGKVNARSAQLYEKAFG